MLKKLFAGVGVTGLLLLGTATAAQAHYVSPEELMPGEDGWTASANSDGDDRVDPGFAECSIIFPENGGGVGYTFAPEERPTGLAQVTATLESFHASVTQTGGTLTVMIDRVPSEGNWGIADISLEIPVGVHGIDLDSVVEVNDNPDLGLPEAATVQDVLDALESADGEYYIIVLNFYSWAGAEVQWLSFGSETYWFGTDAEWFLNNPSCATVVPAPTPPTKVETAVR